MLYKRQYLIFPNTRYVQKLSGLVLVLRYERAPRGATSSERVLTCPDLFAVGTLAPAILSLMVSQTQNGSVCLVVAFRMTEKKEGVCIKFC